MLEDIREAFRALRGNLVRASLTLSIIAIGLCALTGILTAIEAVQSSVSSNMAELGAVTFEVRTYVSKGRGMHARESRSFPDLSLRQAQKAKAALGELALVSIYTGKVSSTLQVSYLSRKTNPNIAVYGADAEYLKVKNLKLDGGRGFTRSEVEQAANVVLIGQEIALRLFGKENPVGKSVRARGKPFLVVGLLAKTGGLMGSSGNDRDFILPISTLRKNTSSSLSIRLTGLAPKPELLPMAMDEAEAKIRNIRGDRPGQQSSFEVVGSESLFEALSSITGNLKIGGLVIGLITLIGAAIGLTNIMLVSVTERTKEIGLRKSLGASSQRVLRQFLTESIIITQVGGLAGIVLGLLAGNLVSGLFGNSSFVVPWGWLLLGVGLCLFTGLAAGYFPARKAASLDPVEALRSV